MNGSSNARALDGGAVLHVTTRQKVVPNRKYHGTIVANCGAEQLTIDPQLDLTWCTPPMVDALCNFESAVQTEF